MPSNILRKLVLGTVVTVGAAITLGKCRLERNTASRIATLHSSANTRTRSSPSTDVSDLPEPVRRYFDTVLENGREHVRTVRLEQRGEFRLGGRSGAWKPMRATQHYTVDPPGFVWDATIEVLPFVPARVVDAYEQGQGSLRAVVLSTLPVATAAPRPEMDEGELLRYLAEAVWFPTALLSNEGVDWEPIDERSARATIEDHGNTASLVFHFDDEGLVERVSTSARYRQEDDSFAPWTGHFADYEWHDGMLIPTTASVAWNLPDGDFPYWRARVTSVSSR